MVAPAIFRAESVTGRGITAGRSVSFGCLGDSCTPGGSSRSATSLGGAEEGRV